jgi:hypothetical protein
MERNLEQRAIDHVIATMSARGICESNIQPYNFEDYRNWLAELTNNHGGKHRVAFAYTLYSLNNWRMTINDPAYKKEADWVVYQFIKYSLIIFIGE